MYALNLRDCMIASLIAIIAFMLAFSVIMMVLKKENKATFAIQIISCILAIILLIVAFLLTALPTTEKEFTAEVVEIKSYQIQGETRYIIVFEDENGDVEWTSVDIEFSVGDTVHIKREYLYGYEYDIRIAE